MHQSEPSDESRRHLTLRSIRHKLKTVNSSYYVYFFNENCYILFNEYEHAVIVFFLNTLAYLFHIDICVCS